MKIGFIGCGNMAKSIIEGILDSQAFSPKNIFVSAKDFDKLSAYCNKHGITASQTNAQTVAQSDVVILAVKPQQAPPVLAEIAPFFNKNKLLISILAGKTIAYFESFFKEQKIIRAMPNLNAAIRNSTTALCTNCFCRKSDNLIAQQIFNCIGKVYFIEEKCFSAFSAAACCSPAFSFMYMDALIEEAKNCGLDALTAKQAVIESVIGSAKMLLENKTEPEQLIKKVCSPGGTTIEGVNRLNEQEFSKTVREAVKASYKKDKLL